jgi:HK97 gp10 family phage protein
MGSPTMKLTLQEFETQLARMESRLVPELYIALQRIGEATQDVARAMPGVEHSFWPPLAESTIEDKVRKGFPVPSPLRRTGEMAESYKYELRPGELAVAVGSEEKTALFHEFGTSRMPPRPVLSRAMMEILPFARRMLGSVANSILTGRPEKLLP